MIRLRGRKGGSEPDDINLAPLIDMTFLLLIFFMVTTSFSWSGRAPAPRTRRPHTRSGWW
jgi:biopolymer transport protein ExbD